MCCSYVLSIAFSQAYNITHIYLLYKYLFFKEIMGPTEHVRVFILLVTNKNHSELRNWGLEVVLQKKIFEHKPLYKRCSSIICVELKYIIYV